MSRARHAVDDPSAAIPSPSVEEIVDKKPGPVDRAGDLPGDPPREDDREDDRDPASDPVGDPDEVWFEAEQLAAASRIEIGLESTQPEDRLLRPGPDHGQLHAAVFGPGLDLGAVPAWPGTDGLGGAFSELLGELRPGDLVLFGGRGRQVGRTSLLAQLGDALAMSQAAVLTPVACMVEEAATTWRLRSLGRWFGRDARVFADPARARCETDLAGLVEDFAAGPGLTLARRQRFVDARTWRDTELRFDLLEALQRWRSRLAADEGREVWPILLVDPLEQLAESEQEPRTLEALAEFARARGWVVLAGCDDPGEDARRSRAYDRHARARLRMAASGDDGLELELCHRRLGPGGRVCLPWDHACGRIG